MNYIEALKVNAGKTLTENGDVTYGTTGSYNLDLFASIGAIRTNDVTDIEERLSKAYNEDADLCLKNIFYGRDVRGGLGERRVFRVALAWLAKNHPNSLIKNVEFISEYGRYDDLLSALHINGDVDNAIVQMIGQQLVQDIIDCNHKQPISLLAKWMPSINTSSQEAVKEARWLAERLKLTERMYRKTMVMLRKHIAIIENNLREKKYDFDYEAVPSRAMFKYRKAFSRNDSERYLEFLNKVEAGETKMHTDNIMPYDIVGKIFNAIHGYWNPYTRNHEVSADEARSLDVMWNNLPDYTDGRNALVVVDGSGSMYGTDPSSPINVSLSLGMYFAERNNGAFHNMFMTFGHRPQMVTVPDGDIMKKTECCMKYNDCSNTDIAAVYDLLLKSAIQAHAKQEDMPETIYIVSDMEFDGDDMNGDCTTFEVAKRKFADHGYKMPPVVFWNVDSRNGNNPVRMDETGVALVSGCTPKTFEMVCSGDTDPVKFMTSTLMGERYKPIKA